MKEALARNPAIELDELAEDGFLPKVRSRGLRALNRITRPLYRQDFNNQVLDRVRHNSSDFLVTYKGNFVHADLLRRVSAMGVKTVNIYPDCSPHAHGKPHREAVGLYDLVISTKEYHPDLWHELYSYQNRCVFVPQGYDPLLHLVSRPQSDFQFDVVMIATYRPEYGRLILDFLHAIGRANIKVAIGGHGWNVLKSQLPSSWQFLGGITGRGYVDALRAGKICVAPLTRQMAVDDKPQPGDVDTTRTYELAAAHCFFVHQRTDFVRDLYESIGVPMFEGGDELAEQVMRYIDAPVDRSRIARAAHQHAVPRFSTDSRAAEIYELLKAEPVA